MGKKKKEAVGKAIVKERNRGLRNPKAKDSWLHTSELNDGYEWGRLNLQSITEQSALNEFLATAELAGTEFTAEKLNITVVTPGRNDGLLSTAEQLTVQQVQDEHKQFLRIPRRPEWDQTTTAEDLALRERDSFLEWRRQISLLQEKEHIILTPFEKNLDFWRQLWRVIERSDVIVQIVDARNPLLFRCEDLEKYVLEVDSNKSNLLLINKADLLTPIQREIWAEYFKERGVPVAFWSALAENERLQKEKEDLEETAQNNRKEEVQVESETVTEQKGEFLHSRFAGLSVDDENLNEAEKHSLEKDNDSEQLQQVYEMNSTRQATTEGNGTTDNLSNCSLSKLETSHRELEKPEILEISNKSRNKEQDPIKQSLSVGPVSEDCNKLSEIAACDRALQTFSPKQRDTTHQEVVKDRTDFNHTGKLVTRDELLLLCQSLGRKPKDQVTTVGMVGYPNVGKSSTINTVLQEKKVSISATPGKTKHFQTLFVDDKLCLCDCPGLVFPSFVSTKAEMVLNGILPIDQMRDHVPPISLLCQHIPREVLELVYGINIAQPEEGEDPSRAPYAEELLNAYGYMRGYMTSHGAPDCPRSARYVLKDYVKGKLLYCSPPPGVDTDLFQEHRYTSGSYLDMEKRKTKQGGVGTKTLLSFLKRHGLHFVATTSIDSSHYVFVQKNVHMNSVDKDFFQQEQVRVFTKGAMATEKYHMMAGQMVPPGAAEVAKALGPGEQLIYKPWKKHHNKNKKEKTRRLVKN